MGDINAEGNDQHNDDVVTDTASFLVSFASIGILTNRVPENNSIHLDRTVLAEAQQAVAGMRSSCPRSTEEQRNLHMSINSLYLAIKDINDDTDTTNLDRSEVEHLGRLRIDCRAVLARLKAYINLYEQWGPLAQRAVNQSGLGAEVVIELSQQVYQSTNALIDFRETIARLEEKLEKFAQMVRTGRLQGSVMSSQTIDELNDEYYGWQQLIGELEDIGVSRRVISQNREFIVRWFKERLPSGLLTEEQHQSIVPEVQPITDEPEVPIKLKTLTGKYITINISLGSRCSDLKAKIEEVEGIHSNSQYIVRRGGRWIPEDSVLRDYG